MIGRLVVDTSVMVAALKSANGASRVVLRHCLELHCLPLIGSKLFTEYEDVIVRSELFRASPLTDAERIDLLDAFLSVAEWIPVFFLWRPNLPDEIDNHLIELAVAGGAMRLVTHNVRDLRRGELRFPQFQIQTPAEYLRDWRQNYGDDDDSNA